MSKRVKSGLAITPAHLKLCDDNLRRANADSRNEFVEKAIEFYAGYLNAEQNPKFFDEMFTSAVQQKMEQVGKSLGTGQYKISVELAKLCHLIAAQMRVTDDQMQRLHQKCSEEVKALGSVPTFEQAYRYQHEGQ
ncbi:hypothetical protein [Caproiciproducens galactitolivorans]|uniref:hypothetical protein n=1 Tax=Caproiciproducens galactitolivorans TaxID=642589 RepID=UPI002408FCD3|nr:hypothetical protein [Caproiciproducens galactitolivorans]